MKKTAAQRCGAGLRPAHVSRCGGGSPVSATRDRSTRHNWNLQNACMARHTCTPTSPTFHGGQTRPQSPCETRERLRHASQFTHAHDVCRTSATSHTPRECPICYPLAASRSIPPLPGDCSSARLFDAKAGSERPARPPTSETASSGCSRRRASARRVSGPTPEARWRCAWIALISCQTDFEEGRLRPAPLDAALRRRSQRRPCRCTPSPVRSAACGGIAQGAHQGIQNQT